MKDDELVQWQQDHPRAVAAFPEWHRAKTQKRPLNVYVESYEVSCRADREWQRAKLESLRWRFGYYQHTPWKRLMQGLGNEGRDVIREASSTTSLWSYGIITVVLIVLHLWVF